MAKDDSKTQILDKRFVTTAVLIGGAYALIITAIGSTVGKEAAGVAGVALTAIATALFKQFETLRFRQIRERDGKEIAIESPTVLLTLASSMAGAQVFVFVLLVLLVAAVVPGERLIAYVLASPETAIPVLSLAMCAVTALTFMVSTYYSVRALRVVRYSTVIFANLVVATGQVALPIVILVISIPAAARPPMWLWFVSASPWLIYLLLSLWGARLARPSQIVGSGETTTPSSPELELMPT